MQKRNCWEVQASLREVYQARARREPVVGAAVEELLGHAKSGKSGCRQCYDYLMRLCAWEEANKEGHSSGQPPEPTA